ncbi:pseudouridine synthase [Methylobacterium nigriterrae]|uniref:pseudouridine synthase n=1 Tax=Methylobacterium nigriterrae TaxID=3127512 RepID=UPI0030140FCD
MSDIPNENAREPDAAREPDPAAEAAAGPTWSPATDANSEPAPGDEGLERRPRSERPQAGRRGGEAPPRRRGAAAHQDAGAAQESRAQPSKASKSKTQTSETGEIEAAPEGERIAKAIARAGIASRRDAEAMIAEGRVTLNGQVLDSPAINVTEADRITIDGEPLPARERTRLWIFHKPRGLVTTARDPEGRQTVFEALPEDLPRVVAVGRLDINTEGLLLLTNDGGLAKVIAHPDTGWLRRYRVRAHGDTDQAALDALRKGVTIDGMAYGPIEAHLDRVQGDNLWLTLGLREGKNREVKRILEHLGLAVNRLIRLSFGPFQLGDLEAGLVEEVRTRVLKDQLGASLAAQAGVDFESPVREPIEPFGSPKQAAKEAANQAAETSREAGRARPARGRSAGEDRAPAFGRPARPPTPARVPTGGMGAGPRRSVWRADEAGETGFTRPAKVPRRGADPRSERAGAAERGRERVGAIRTGERRVVVERLMASPPEPLPEPHRRTRFRKLDEAAPARAPRPPRRHEEAGGSAERPRREASFRPRPGEGGERPPSRRDRGGEERGYGGGAGRPGTGFGDKPRSGFGGERSGGFKGASRSGGAAERGGPRGGSGGPKGDFKGDFKSGARGDFKRDFKGGGARDGKPGGFKAGGFKPGSGKPGGGRPGGRPGSGKPGGSRPGGRPPRGAR